MSRSGRPRRCSRITYSAMRSSLRVRDERNENTLLIESVNPTGAASIDPRGSGGLARPFEVGVGNRIAVRVVCGKAECAVDPRFELLRDDVLQPVGLVVNRVDVEAKCLGEIELEQPVMADHLERDARTRVGQLRAAVALVVEQLER